MAQSNGWDRVIASTLLFFGVTGCAYAYIDPGTASMVWAAGLAPIVAGLAWLGRWFIQLFRKDQEEDTEDQAPEADATAETDDDKFSTF